MHCYNTYVQVFPVFRHLVCDDIIKVWEVAPIFKNKEELHVIIADPIEVLVSCIRRTKY